MSNKKSLDVVDLTCMECGKIFKGMPPLKCCSGVGCGCMGMPTEPVMCSKECEEKGTLTYIKAWKPVDLSIEENMGIKYD